MAQYINKAIVMAEIERKYETNLIGAHSAFRNGKIEALREVKDFLDTVEVEEANEAMYGKPAWSEEDKEMIDETLYFIREYQQSNRCKDENGMQNSVTCEKWLKSLKERIGGE